MAPSDSAMMEKQQNTSVPCTGETWGQRAAGVPAGSAEHPTYFPTWCCRGKQRADHQSWQFSFSSCGCTRSCDTASDVKGEEKAAFSSRCKHRDIIPPLILISFHKYSHITRSKTLIGSLLLYPCYQVSQLFSGMECVYHCPILIWDKEHFMLHVYTWRRNYRASKPSWQLTPP